MHNTTTTRSEGKDETPHVNLSADPDPPLHWWNNFVESYQRTNEAYISRYVCFHNRLNPSNPVAQAQWATWLMYVMNRKLLGDDPTQQSRVSRTR